MSEDIKDILDMEKTCRTCLAHKPPSELESLLENGLSVALNEVTNVQVALSPTLPIQICIDCVKVLHTAWDFQKQVRHVEEQLKKLISDNEQSDQITVIYKAYAVLNEGSEGDPQNVKESLLIVEEENVKSSDLRAVRVVFKDHEDIAATTQELQEDTGEPISYLVTNEESNNSANNLSKSNVIKWAEAQNTENLEGSKLPKITNFSCEWCSKTFRFEFIYKKHLLKHGRPFGCEMCLLLFKDTNVYLSHVKTNHPDYKPFGCPHCDKRFFTLTPLKMHFKEHMVDQENAFECNICHKKYFNGHSLKVHKKTHTNPQKCSICGKKLSGSHSLRNHLKIHKGERKHKCPTCGATFIHRFSLNSHLRVHTGEKPFICKICQSRFSTSSYLKIHLRTHTDEKPYVCGSCSKSFISRCALVAHLKAHSGEKKFQCDICGWRSIRSADLKTHIRKHTGEKPYNCDQCGKCYKTASNLAAHRKTHSNRKEHLCNVCDKSFLDPRTLKSHLRIHTGEMPYQCDVCGHRFRQSGQLSTHRKIHHRDREIVDNT